MALTWQDLTRTARVLRDIAKGVRSGQLSLSDAADGVDRETARIKALGAAQAASRPQRGGKDG